MRRRVFIAINLPEDIKDKFVSYQDKWPELPVRWTKKENLHITLEFLGYIQDEEIPEVCRRTGDFAAQRKIFTVVLNKICYGPPGKMPPRMVWVTGPKIEELGTSPHITLARIKTWAWKQIEPEERPNIEEDINLNFEVNSIDVMESQLKRGGPQYTTLCGFTLSASEE